MAYKIKQSKLFLVKVTKLLLYLEEKWNKKVADEFTEKIDKNILKLSESPNYGKDCKKIINVKRIVVTNHNKLFYRIKGYTLYKYFI
jgi:plasmid stabilization system protein ParE